MRIQGAWIACPEAIEIDLSSRVAGDQILQRLLHALRDQITRQEETLVSGADQGNEI